MTSLKAFLDQVDPAAGIRFHLLTAYPQTLIQPGGCMVRCATLPRGKIYGPESRIEKALSRLFPQGAGHLAFLLDFLFSGWPYATAVFRYIRHHRIDMLHLNNSILINDYGIVGGFLAGIKVLVQVRAPEYPSRIARILARMVDQFLPVSGYVRSSLTALGIPPRRIITIPEGLDVAAFIARAQEKISLPGRCDQPSTPVIGMVGCLVPWKGHDIFLNACAQVLKKTPALIYIAGDTPDNTPAYRQKLQKQARALGIFPNVHFLGHCENVASVMACCDVLVHGATAPEPFGRVILEAMALGKPVVATAAGGPAEVITPGKDGLLVSPGDAHAMAAGILLLLSDARLRHRMGKAAASKVRRRYGADRHTRTLIRAYTRWT